MPAVIVDTYIERGGKKIFPHDPNETTDYPFDWSQWLARSGNDTITNAEAVLEAPLELDHIGFDTQHATIWVKGGAAGALARVTCRITTAGGRVQDRSIFLQVKER